MRSPIRSSIGQVFIPVRDMAISAEWYSRLLGLEPGEASHGGTIFDLPTEGGTRLALDANRPDFDPAGPPRFFWWCDDVGEVRRFLAEVGVEVLGDVVDIGSVSFLQFADPDGNTLMVCERN